jgi:hypothetical protein
MTVSVYVAALPQYVSLTDEVNEDDVPLTDEEQVKLEQLNARNAELRTAHQKMDKYIAYAREMIAEWASLKMVERNPSVAAAHAQGVRVHHLRSGSKICMAAARKKMSRMYRRSRRLYRIACPDVVLDSDDE